MTYAPLTPVAIDGPRAAAAAPAIPSPVAVPAIARLEHVYADWRRRLRRNLSRRSAGRWDPLTYADAPLASERRP